MIYYLARDRRVIPNSFDHQPTEIKEAINSFIDGLISFAHANGTSFYVRDLVGKKVYPNGWSGIPLDAIYQYHVNRGTENPVDQAGKDIGYIFKERIMQSNLMFKLDREFNNLYTPM